MVTCVSQSIHSNLELPQPYFREKELLRIVEIRYTRADRTMAKSVQVPEERQVVYDFRANYNKERQAKGTEAVPGG